MNTSPVPRARARRFESSVGLTLLSLSVLLPGHLVAQAPATSQESVVVLSPFTVSSQAADRYRAEDAVSAVRVRAPLLDTPSSITVLTRDMIDDIAPNRVFDVTRYVAGVQEGRGLQFQDRMIIRGFETQNGARTVDNFLQSADADNVEEAVIDRIEVTKGPNAILSPAGAPGGSLNIITKSPLYQRHNTLTAQVGLYDAQKATLDLGGPFGDSGVFAYRFIASGQDTRRYWGPDNKMRSYAIAPMLAWRIGNKSQLTLKYISAEHWIFREPLLILDPGTTATSGDPKLLPGIDPSGSNGIQPWSHVGTHSDDAFAIFTSNLTDHVSLRAAANARHYFEDSDQDFLSTGNFSARYNPMTGELTQDYTWALKDTTLPYNATANPYVSTYNPWINPSAIPNRGNIQDTRRDTYNFQVDLAATYQFGGASSQTIVGAANSHQHARSLNKDGTLPAIDLAHPVVVYPTYPATWPTNQSNSGSSYDNRQLYVSERVGLLDNRLYLSGGILNFASVVKNWNAITGTQTSKLDDSKNMWSLSALGKVRDNVSVYYSHSTNANPTIVNSTQALWRDGEQDEAGVKSEWFGKRLSVNGAWFKISQTNVTVPNPAYQTDPTQPQTLVSDLSNHGYEAELFGQLTPSLSAIATYTHLHMRDALGRMVRGVADDNASLLLNYRFNDSLIKGLSANFGVVYSGRRAGDSASDGGNFTQLGVVKQVSFYLKPQYVTTLGVSYRMNEKLSFRLIIDNLFDDKDYISVAGGRITGTGLTTQPGFNARFSTTLAF
ncbi:MAG TPA: TonB-dependent receptor plug domain-containing protein [Lacunisphaera sp.]|nr:TonB-dependent receptor plug domain-containing protein [Lacunisphaera sp.]